jgi:quercetin dioxygenase-like cupin family protein
MRLNSKAPRIIEIEKFLYGYIEIVINMIERIAGSTLIKEIISTENARVAEYSISPRTRGRNHIHRNVFEELFCLSGRLRVEITGHNDHQLNAGDKLLIPAGTRHCIINDSDSDARFLVVQGGGMFDLITSEK